MKEQEQYLKNKDNILTCNQNIVSNNINESLLIERTRQELITQGRKGANYSPSNQFRGKNRFERKKYSSISRNVSQYNDIDMNTFFKKDILTVGVRVQGETDYYMVKLKFLGVLKEMSYFLKKNAYNFNYNVVLQALTRVFNTGDVYVGCDCKDFKYRFQFWSTKNNYNSIAPQNIPSDITNPDDTKGSGCKHILLVLANLTWLLKVASVINNYINYAEKNLQKIYADYIFPKLYGVKYSKDIQLTLADSDEIKTDKDLINLVNRYGRNRGRFSTEYQPTKSNARNNARKPISDTNDNNESNSSQKEKSVSNGLKQGKNNDTNNEPRFTKNRNNDKKDEIEPIS